MGKRFQVGDLVHFTDDDPWFDTWEEAVAEARELSEGDVTVPFGVWDEAGDCILVVYEGKAFETHEAA